MESGTEVRLAYLEKEAERSSSHRLTVAEQVGGLSAKQGVANHRLDTINGDVREIKVGMDKLVKQVTTLVTQHTDDLAVKKFSNAVRIAVLVIVGSFCATVAARLLGLT